MMSQALRVAVVRDGYGGGGDAMTYAALVKHNQWDVNYRRNPPLTAQETPGLMSLGYATVNAATIMHCLRTANVVEGAELGYSWTRELIDVATIPEGRGSVLPRFRVFPLVWQNLPWIDVSEHTPVIIHGAAGFIARSSMACDLLRLYGVGHERIHLCHASVDTERFKAERIRSGKDDDRVTIGFAGRPVPEKGLNDIMAALRALPRELRERTRLLLAGGFSLTIDSIDGIALGTYPAIPHHEMPGFYAMLDVFVYPSWPTTGWLEQWGLSVVEAMSSGLPVITTDVGAFREMIPPELKAHWTVPARDWVGLRDRLAALIENESLRRTLGARNREHVCERFDGRETAVQYRRAFNA